MTDKDFSDDEIFEKYRSRRINEIKHREVKEIENEQELIKLTMKDTMIVYFYKKEFVRCSIMNDTLIRIFDKFKNIDFYKIEADKCLIVAEKLDIKALPFLGFFHKGFFVDSIVGFENIGENVLNENDLINFIKNSNIYK